MKIAVSSKEDCKFEEQVEVYALYFDIGTKAFSMQYCDGDMWNIPINCDLDICPTSISFFVNTCSVRFDRQDEAAAFTTWLRKSEEKVQHGFRTMQG